MEREEGKTLKDFVVCPYNSAAKCNHVGEGCEMCPVKQFHDQKEKEACKKTSS